MERADLLDISGQIFAEQVLLLFWYMQMIYKHKIQEDDVSCTDDI